MLWPFQQLGVLVVGPIVALVAAIFRHFRLAAAILLATVAKLAVGARRQGHRHPAAARAPRSVPTSHLRGDVSSHGPSFVSGHAVLDHRTRRARRAVSAAVDGRSCRGCSSGLVMFTRVYVGAHNPLDVICGAALGFVIAGCLNLLFGVPASRDA